MPPDRGLMDKPTSGVKGNKKRITYAFTANADGSEKLCPFIIGKSARSRAFQRKTGKQLGFYYRSNAKAWMTTVLYQEWLRKWDTELRRQRRFILLFQDNFGGHAVPNGLTNIRVENFRPNLTSHVQPNDAGIIRCFKAHYRSKFVSRAIDRYNSDVPPGLIYSIDQLEAMRLADAAWNEVNSTTIHNCWVKSGILPEALVCGDATRSPSSTTSVPASSSTVIPPASESRPSISVPSHLNPHPIEAVLQAEQMVSDSLNQLEARGVLQRSNRMAIEELLNPVSEHENMEETSEEEKCRSVQELRQATEMMEINGGDDGDEEEVAPKPTRKEALAAALTLGNYVADINDPFARKLEALTARFGRQTQLEATHDMQPTLITDYFTRN